MASDRNESRRQVELTSSDLVIVPEKRTLGDYFRTQGAFTDRLAKAMLKKNVGTTAASSTDPDPLKNDPTRSSVSGQLPARGQDRDRDRGQDDETVTARYGQEKAELELDKFMAALTARECPDAVIETIGSEKSL